MRIKLPALMIVAAVVVGGASAQARTLCRRNAISAAKHAATGYSKVFDINRAEETPDLISYEVVLADVLPEPNATTTVEVTLAKVTCALIQNPVQK